MGFLEDLKKGQNEQDISPEDRDGVALKRRHFEKTIQGTMHSLYVYLSGLAEHLIRVPPDALITYEVGGCKGLTGLAQRGFAAEVDDEASIQTCILRYECSQPTSVEFYKPNRDSGERQQQYLWKHKLRFSTKKASDERWLFSLESFVPVEFEYTVDAKRLGIRLKVRNHETLGAISYTYAPDDINDLYLDELAKHVMRKPSRFHALSGDVVPEDTLAKLRQQVAERKAERDQELGEAGTEQKPGPRKKGLFKNLFKK